MEKLPKGMKRIGSGDEWDRYKYRGQEVFCTTCGTAGYYLNGGWILDYLKTPFDVKNHIDKMLKAREKN